MIAYRLDDGEHELEEYQDVGGISNYYGGIFVLRYSDKNGKHYWKWGIENYDGIDLETIPGYLAEALLRFHNERKGEEL